MDETDIKVRKQGKYLYRAVDKAGQTIEFMLGAKRDVSAAKRFFKKMMRAEHRRLPFSISVDKNAAYPEAFSALQEERVAPNDCQLRRVKYLNNVIEQNHRFIKKKVRASQCFKSFHTAERALEGLESINMIRKGQATRLAGSDAQVRRLKDNVLPSRATAIVNFRILPGDSIENVMAYARRVINDPRVKIEKYGDDFNEPSNISNIDSAEFTIIHKTVRQVFPNAVVAPALVVGATDSRHYERLTRNVYRFLLYRFNDEDISRLHGTNERLSVENYLQGVRFYYQLINNSTRE